MLQISNTCLLTDLQRFLPQLESLQLESGLGEGLLPQQLHFLHSCSYPGEEKCQLWLSRLTFLQVAEAVSWRCCLPVTQHSCVACERFLRYYRGLSSKGRGSRFSGSTCCGSGACRRRCGWRGRCQPWPGSTGLSRGISASPPRPHSGTAADPSPAPCSRKTRKQRVEGRESIRSRWRKLFWCCFVRSRAALNTVIIPSELRGELPVDIQSFSWPSSVSLFPVKAFLYQDICPMSFFPWLAASCERLICAGLATGNFFFFFNVLCATSSLI